MRLVYLLALLVVLAQCNQKPLDESQGQGDRVTIIRDNWGVPHVFGKTDADAVYGLIYAQCEDDFNRVEVNYINAMGRMAEVEGEASLMSDLRMHLFIDTTKAVTIYNESPDWMKNLLDAFAEGANQYLADYPETKPKLITHFRPWMPLMFSEGSIGGDIESISLKDLAAFYDKENPMAVVTEEWDGDGWEKEPTGSNGFALAPSKSASGKALFYINPHTSFYFRPEVHVVSEEGLNAYGAVTWGQFFVYQGFNERCGWMHTSSRADAIDEYMETVVDDDGKMMYKYGDALRPVESETITLAYKNGTTTTTKDFTVYKTHHGPVIAEKDGKWISISLMNEPLKALTQSFTRTKAKSYEEFNNTMALTTNSSNNTVYADADGNIAYFHGNFIPVRDPSFDWNNPVDGSNPATDWKGLHPVSETINVLNPTTGWIQNCNSTPFTVSGEASPKKEDYPAYMAPDYENFRGIHAIRVLKDSSNFTIEKLIATGYDSYLPAFEKLIPSLLSAYQKARPVNKDLKEPVELLRGWDYRFGEESVATTLAIYWAQELRKMVADELPPRYDPIGAMDYLINKTSANQKVKALENAVSILQGDFANWKTGWGQINRYQRLTGEITPTFDDTQPSYPVGFASSLWGSLASYGSRTYPETVKWYGTSGNSFVAAVEFGEKIKAKSSLAGGNNGDPKSPHFNDQGEMYSKGQFKDVLFYREDIEKHAERIYNPRK
ncbi:MAG: penicillin acylase family protein [Cyclobacteriaceae bacterium]|nr:penicillin acylase family protein [Cyclobacteriaceae bacterium]